MTYRVDKPRKSDVNGGAGIDTRSRLLIVLMASLGVLLLRHPLPLGILFVASGIYLVETRRWRVQVLSYAVLLVLVLSSILLMNLLAWFLPVMRGQGLVSLLAPFLRMGVMLQVVLALALNLELRDVVRLVHRFRLPRTLCLPLMVSVRFLPGLLDDVKQVRDCLRLRGYGGVAGLHPRLWLLPLIFRAFHLTDDLATAAELKGIGYGRPTHLGLGAQRRTRFLLPVIFAVILLSGAVALDRSLSVPQALHTEAPPGATDELQAEGRAMR
jgi:energy-coupling factor transport system permease protein